MLKFCLDPESLDQKTAGSNEAGSLHCRRRSRAVGASPLIRNIPSARGRILFPARCARRRAGALLSSASFLCARRRRIRPAVGLRKRWLRCRVFGSSVAAKAEKRCRQSCDGKYADQSGFHESFSFFYLQCMKASRDGLALYTMQNGKGARLFRGVGREYFLQKRE